MSLQNEYEIKKLTLGQGGEHFSLSPFPPPQGFKFSNITLTPFKINDLYQNFAGELQVSYRQLCNYLVNQLRTDLNPVVSWSEEEEGSEKYEDVIYALNSLI